MPHVTIKHFPASLTDAQEADLVAAVTEAIRAAFGCSAEVVSIATEEIPSEEWHSRVYVPEILRRDHLLRKTPDY
ncbi:tautomerase family protein [Actinocorallia sp. A-T 12471]|uniref:tautomerase family protein n=1 Tax=Actinocorallia sp. A-T 12471 TaxID=3089813 RepID=UPI0029CE9A11|nr:tautomerase family protein [Actinocorallia sp. A-T 12471]MDX6741637.1 tautomerase family protein [Actinocorallia sp. A-T 12471]